MTNRFIDKAHAEAVVWCLEAHFRRISTLLDAATVPITYNGIPLTVEQRIWLLKESLEEACGNRTEVFNRIHATLTALPPDTSAADGPDPEALNAALSDDGIEWPVSTEQVNAIFANMLKGEPA